MLRAQHPSPFAGRSPMMTVCAYGSMEQYFIKMTVMQEANIHKLACYSPASIRFCSNWKRVAEEIFFMLS